MPASKKPSRINERCKQGRNCILLTNEIVWDHDSRKTEHQLQKQYNGITDRCVLHTCAAEKIALQRRAAQLDVYKRILGEVSPEDLAQYRLMRQKWRGLNAYARIKTLCPLARTLRDPIFKTRSKLKLSEVSSDSISVCLSHVGSLL